MNPQFLADGILTGALLGLGGVGLTLAYSILRFANFVHGDFLTVGAYAALVAAGVLSQFLGNSGIGPFSFGWPLIVALPVAMATTGALALLLDWLLFRRLRRRGEEIVLVMASFGASLAVRSLIEFAFTPEPKYYSQNLQIAMPLSFGVRATPDQLAVVVLAGVAGIALHILLTRTAMGRAMRAVAENPALARVAGIDPARVVRATWWLGGGLAALAGVFLGLTVQIRPYMGFDLLLPLFASVILGGVGSVPGALAGGMIVGVAEALAVPLIGAAWRGGVAFLLLLAVLLVRPQGLFGMER